MNDKKDYTEEVLPDGLNLIQFRVKRALDSAEREFKRSFYLISKDINGFKSDAKNIRTEEEKMALLYRINSSKSTINVILEERPLLKDFVTNIKIDGKILTKLGYGSKVFEIMRERERSQMEAFQKELLKLEDEVMSIDFTNISPLPKTVENSKPSKEQQENSSNEYKFEEDFLNELFKKCEYHFKCSYREFVEAMSKANFNKIIQRKGCKKSYCYAFIAIIGKINHDWYNNVFNNLKGIDGLNIKELKDISKYIRKDNSWQNQIKKILMKYYEI